MIRELTFEEVYRTCSPESMGGSHSSQLNTLKTIIGQERAVRAGERIQGAVFEENTVNGLVDKRLRELAEMLAQFGKKDEKSD